MQLALNLPRRVRPVAATAPIKQKAAPVPFDDRFRLYDSHPFNRSWAYSVEPAPNKPVGGNDLRRMSLSAFEHRKLMPKCDKLQFQGTPGAKPQREKKK